MSAGSEVDAGRRERLEVALLAAGAGDEPERIVGRLADEPDATMPEVDEVAGRYSSAVAVVDGDAGETLPPRVDENGRVRHLRRAHTLPFSVMGNEITMSASSDVVRGSSTSMLRA